MDVVFQDLPFLHPVAVHFPIAFSTAAFLGAAVWLATGGRFWRHLILTMLALSLLGGAAAFVTGEAQAGATEISELVALHTAAGGYGFGLTGLALIVMLALNFYLERRTTIRRHPPDPPWVRITVSLLVVAAWIATAVAGYSGHLLVWG